MTTTSDNDKYTGYAEDCVENILDAIEDIHAYQITILTGENATGKSLIRKLIWSKIKEEVGEYVKVADISMERRTGLHSELGGMGVFLRDMDTDATSSATLRFIKGLVSSSDQRYIVIDEPELGMSESLQASVAEYFNKVLPELLTKNYGVLIITHSKQIVKRLNVADKFVNIQKLTKEAWLNKEPEVIDLEEFEAKAKTLYDVLNKRLKPTSK